MQKDNAEVNTTKGTKGITLDPIRFVEDYQLAQFLDLADIEKIDLSWVLTNHNIVTVFFLNDDKRLNRLLALFDFISDLQPLAERKAITLRIVIVGFDDAPAGDDLFADEFEGVL